jgi:hypothetical protein
MASIGESGKIGPAFFLPGTTEEQNEATKLLKFLEKQLAQFEKGEPFVTTSSGGKSVKIEDRYEQGFIHAFLPNLGLLLKKSSVSPQHKKAFYTLLGQLLQSKTFLSLYPKGRGTSTHLEKKAAEQAFIARSSLETLEPLLTLAPAILKTEEPSVKLVKQAPEVKEKRLKDIWKKCFSPIVSFLKTVFSLCALIFVPDTELRMAHARFHRKAIDGDKYKDGFPILDGGFPGTAFSHFMEYDWTPARALFENVVLDPQTIKRLKQTEKILENSKSLFYDFLAPFIPLFIKKKLVIAKVNKLKENEKFVFPGGMSDHAILYEVEKIKEGVKLRVYNAGRGTVYVGTEFLVPEYTISSDKIEEYLTKLVYLSEASEEEFSQKYTLEKTDSQLLYNAINKILNQKHPVIYAHHTVQDRGNCFWKSFSTWMNTQLKGCIVTVSQDMVEASKTIAPYATEDLQFLANSHESIPITEFMHRLAYGKTRMNFSKLFTKHTSTPISELKKGKIHFYSFVGYHSCLEKKKATRTDADNYITSLVQGIISTSAAERYRKKKRR